MKNIFNIRKALVVIMAMILMISAGANNHLQAMSNEAEANNNYSATYEDADVKVNVSANAGVLPADAQLSVKAIKQQEVSDAMSEEEKALAAKVNEQYQKTSEKINEKNTNVEGFLAYDISFSVNGVEIEPNGDVNVSMEFVKAVKPEGVSDDAVASVQHLKESGEDVVVETLDKEQDVITVDGKAAVKTVDLQTNSFSIFTITWNRPSNDGHGYGINTLKVKVLDNDGKEIDLGDANIEFKISEKEKTTAVLANDLIKNANGKLDDYTLSRAYILQSGQQKNFARMARFSNPPDSTGGFQANTDAASYNYNTWDKDTDGEKYVYFVFKKKIKFTTLDTIDSISKGIHMKMIDYYPASVDKKQFLGADYDSITGDPKGQDVARGAKQGMLSNKLGADGYPTFENKWKLTNQAGNSLTNTSLINFFQNATGALGTAKEANHLFLESVYSDTGHYYYYDSSRNAATFNSQEGKFTVYDQLVTPKYNNQEFFYKRGNFLPFNTFNNPGVANNPNLYQANGEKLLETDPLYKAPLYTPDQTTKFTFGMELSANFVQNQNGYFDGNNMRYEFTGDDDLWVYIDDVLVLDIGGSHDAREGYIDFSTGEVYVQGKGLTSLKAQFEKAGIDNIEWKEVQYVSRDGKETKGYIFNDFTSHKFKMWYMERGGGASNLRIKFNLPVIPEDQIQIRKELGNDEDDIKYGDESYGYKLYTIQDGKYVQVLDPNTYSAQLQKSDGITLENLKMNDQGIFYLKPDETAIFNGIGAYYVEEVGIDTNVYDKVTINGDESKIENKIAKSKEFSATDTQMVVFKNYPKAEYLSNLTIEKAMKAGQSSEDSFDINVKMENADGDLAAYRGNYELIERDGKTKTQTTKNGVIKLKTGEKAIIKNILTGTNFYVDETVGEEYGKPIYTATNATIASDKKSVSGTTNKNNDVTVKVENRLARVGNLKLLKVDQGNNNLTLKGVEFAIYEGDKSLMSATSQANGIVSFDIHKLQKDHEYVIKETKGADKYLSGIMVNGKAVEYLKLVVSEQKNDDGTITTEGKLFTPNDEEVTLKDGAFVVENLKDTRISIDVEKKWEDKDYVNRPKEVEIQLYQKVLDQEATLVKDKKVILKADNDWKDTFKDLPYWDEKTKTPIEYSVKEVLSMEEYESKVTKKKEYQSGYEVYSFVVTNTLKTGSLIINKDIIESEVNPALGDPIFTFEITRDDGSLKYYRTIRLSELNLSGSVRIDDLPYGKYTVKELDTLRYTCVSEVTQKATINDKQKIAVVSYKNKLTKDDLFSHTDVIENQFAIAEDGTITITKNKLEKVDKKAILPELDDMVNTLLQAVKEVE